MLKPGTCSTVLRELLGRREEQWFSNFSMCQSHLEGWWKHRRLNPTPALLIQPVRVGASNLPSWQGCWCWCSWRPRGWTFLDWHLTCQRWGSYRRGSYIVCSLLCVCIFLFVAHRPVSHDFFLPGSTWWCLPVWPFFLGRCPQFFPTTWLARTFSLAVCSSGLLPALELTHT